MAFLQSLLRLSDARTPVVTANITLRIVSVGLRALLTLTMAVWLQPAELGLFALIAATLTLSYLMRRPSSRAEGR